MSVGFLIAVISVVAVAGLCYFVLISDMPRADRKRSNKEKVAGGKDLTEHPADVPAQRRGSTASAESEGGRDDAGLEPGPQPGYWEDRSYCWVVLCKNHWFHLRQNWFYRYRIALGETDAISPPPTLEGKFPVKCDSCGREYFYKPSDVLRYEAELPKSFKPHPLFQG